MWVTWNVKFYFNPGCEGVVVLSSFHHNYELVVNSTKLRARERNGRKIKAKNPESKERISFQIVKFEGDCCWHVRNQYRGGQKRTSTRVGVHIPGWNIKAVELCKHDQLWVYEQGDFQNFVLQNSFSSLMRFQPQWIRLLNDHSKPFPHVLFLQN